MTGLQIHGSEPQRPDIGRYMPEESPRAPLHACPGLHQGTPANILFSWYTVSASTRHSRGVKAHLNSPQARFPRGNPGITTGAVPGSELLACICHYSTAMDNTQIHL